MTNKPMLSVELRAGLERLLENGYAQYLTKIDTVELRALLDNPVFESQYAGMNQQQAQAVSDGVDEILHGKPAAQHQGYPVNRLSYSQGDRRYVNGWNDACSHWEVRSAPEAHESECASCDGSGEYTDAIGDWRGYCTCPAGVDAEGIKGLKP